MSDYDNTNRGGIWKNDKKLTDNHPDFTGSLDVEGVEYWVSAWKRKSDANGKAPALKFSIQKKEEAQSKPPIDSQAKAMAADPEFDDDIPF